jgi:hypothetical protein
MLRNLLVVNPVVQVLTRTDNVAEISDGIFKSSVNLGLYVRNQPLETGTVLR